MGYRRDWGFIPPYEREAPRHDTSFRDYIAFTEWQDEKKKRWEEEEKKKKDAPGGNVNKNPNKEWSKKEIAITMFLLSPMIGIPVAFGYIMAFKAFIQMVTTVIK